MDVRDERAKSRSGFTNANGLQISSMLLVRKEKAMGSWKIADPPSIRTPTAPTGTRRFNTEVCQNVAGLWLKYGVKLLKNRDFFAVRDSVERCDDLLTSTVDKADRAGL